MAVSLQKLGSADGPVVIYQGYLCSPIYSYTRTLGLEPDFGYVFIDPPTFGPYKFDVSNGPSGLGRVGGTVERGPPGRGGSANRSPEGFSPIGDLVLREVIGGKSFETLFRNVLVAPSPVVAAFPTDASNTPQDTADARVPITDIRLLWRTQGEVSGLFNVLKAGTGIQLSGATVTVGDVAAIPLSNFIKGSLRNGTEKWTLERILEEKIVPNLPGVLGLKRMPEDLKAAIPSKEWPPGTLAKQALAELLFEFGMLLALNPDSTIGLWKPMEGDPQLQNGSDFFATNPEEVAYVLPSATIHHIPDLIQVTGGPILGTVRLKCIPVSEVAGVLRPIRDGLSLIGLSPAQADAFAVLPADQRIAKNFDPKGKAAGEFDRWYGKYWRIIDAETANADKLPMQGRPVDGTSAKPSLGATLGQLAPIGVFTERTGQANLAQMALEGTLNPTAAGNSSSQKYRLIAAAAASRIGTKNATVVLNLGFGEVTSGFRIDRERGLVIFDQIQGHVLKEGVPGSSPFNLSKARIEVEFGYYLSPGECGDKATRYVSFWSRQADGSARQLRNKPAGAIPHLIDAPELAQRIDISGRTNVSILNAIAQKKAEEEFKRPTTTSAYELHVTRPLPLICTGAVQQVSWSAGPTSGPQVIASIGGTHDTKTPADRYATRTRDPSERTPPAGEDIQSPRRRR